MKNRTLRIGLIVAVLAIVTSCFMGSTFAKYVTNDSEADTARVAKWGVTVEMAAFDDGFATTYDGTVSSSTSEKLLAPGTGGTFGLVVLGGTPEVDVRVNYSADIEFVGWQLADSSIYCPIVVTVDGVEYKYTSGTIVEFETAIENAIAAYSREYDANTDLSSVGSDALKISWAWEYESGNDDKDTYLGNQASINNAPVVNFSMTCTVTQVD